MLANEIFVNLLALIVFATGLALFYFGLCKNVSVEIVEGTVAMLVVFAAYLGAWAI